MQQCQLKMYLKIVYIMDYMDVWMVILIEIYFLMNYLKIINKVFMKQYLL